jgi:hypothetical protein
VPRIKTSKVNNVKSFDFKNVKPSQLGEWVVKNCGEEDVDPNLLLDNPYNPNEHGKEQIAFWRESVAGLGWLGRVIVNKKNNHIIEGHMRTEDARQRKIKTIPVQWVWIETVQEEKKILAIYTRIGENAVINRMRMGEIVEDIREDLGEMAAAFFAKLPDLQTMGEQLTDAGFSLFDDPRESDDFFGDEGEDEDDPFGDIEPVATAKSGMVKLVLTGDSAEEFRRLVTKIGKAGELGHNTKALVILAG